MSLRLTNHISKYSSVSGDRHLKGLKRKASMTTACLGTERRENRKKSNVYQYTRLCTCQKHCIISDLSTEPSGVWEKRK